MTAEPAAPAIERLRAWLGRDAAADLLAAPTPRRALRVNTLKSTRDEVRARLDALGMRLEPVPFAPDEAFFLDDPLERLPGTLWEHQAGAIFSQDAASMLAVLALDPQPGERVLDLCAAPGGKTTHIAARMRGEGLVVANEVSPGRANNLVSTIDRMGALNVVVTRRDGRHARWPFAFDRVLVDAPCSNLGALHHDPDVARRGEEDTVARLVRVQRSLLAAAFDAVRPGGVIVFSTCTLEPRENEGVASWFLDHFDVEAEPFDPGVGRPGLVEAAGERFREEVQAARRLHPGDAGTDGFFAARFRKRRAPPRLGAPRAAPGWEDASGHVARLADAFGLRDARLADAQGIRGPNRTYVARVPSLDEALALAPQRIGVALARPDAGGERLTFDATTTFGRGAVDAFELSEEEARRWMVGAPVHRGPRDWRVIVHAGEPLGCGRFFDQIMQSFVPRERRVPLDGPERVGFVAARRALGNSQS